MNGAIAPLRRDLDAVPVEEDGQQFVLLRDPGGYASDVLLLRPEAWAIALLFDGRRTEEVIRGELAEQWNLRVDGAPIRSLAEALSSRRFLHDATYEGAKRDIDALFLAADLRAAAHAGVSYSDDPAELAAFLDGLYENDATPVPEGDLCGAIAPHIDLQVGPDVYVPAFRCLRAAAFDVLVVFGTSHSCPTEGLFIPTEKSYATPLGPVPTDRDVVRRFRAAGGSSVSTDDLPHRTEHSIEFPCVFLRHVFGDTKPVVPILLSSFESYAVSGTLPAASDGYRRAIDVLREALAADGRRVAYLLSVDWSHVGRKFGDDADAGDILPVVRVTDHQHFAALERADFASFCTLLARSGNATRIDGYACIAAFFDLAHPARGTLLKYDQWHEEVRASGVTYASLAFFRS